MSRRRKSNLEVMIQLAAKLPAWVSLLFAVISYFALHYVASQEIAVSSDMAHAAETIRSSFAKTLSTFFQYLLPLVFTLGAAASWFQNRKRIALLQTTQARGKVSALLDMSWQQFEQLVGQAFRQHGYAVVETGGKGPDGGMDLVLTKDNERYLVQCKQWRAQKVGVTVVRELLGIMTDQGAVCGFVVTTGGFTSEAEAFAEGQNIVLVNGEQLLTFINKAMPGAQVNAATQVPAVVASSTPSCPACGKSMVTRLAKKGPNIGESFWGCSGYPKCRGVVNK